MDASISAFGADEPNAAPTLNRIAAGTFFAISGYHKPFNASRHATLTRTLQDDDVRAVPVMQWRVPGVECSAGCALIVGLLSALAAFGLLAADQPGRLARRCALPARSALPHRIRDRDAGRGRGHGASTP